MPEIPYIPQATPITVTIDGHWDGMHNGNEPYMTYQGHDGQSRKIHIPHGAYVQTNPEEAPDVAFTVDKTPKHPHDYSDVIDTGEPLDADPDSMSYEEAEYWCRMDDYDAAEDTPRKPEYGDRVRVSYEAEYHEHADDGHFVRPNDLDFPILTPSDVEITVIEPARPAVPEEPEPGDRVPKIGDTVAVPLNDENGTIIVGSLVATYDDKFWIEGDDFDLQVPHQGSRITVIEPARTAVPDDVYAVTTHGGETFVRVMSRGSYLDEWADGVHENYTYAELEATYGELFHVARGPVIGG